MRIRHATAPDAPAIAAIYRPYVETSLISFEEEPPGADEMERRIRGDGTDLYPWLVAEEDGVLLGYAASSPFRTRPAYRWTVETGIYLAEPAKGRGIGKALLAGLLDLLERQGFVAAIGAIALPNPASVKLHEMLRFTRTGTYRQVGFKMQTWVDVGLWQKDLATRTAMPSEPLPFVALPLR